MSCPQSDCITLFLPTEEWRLLRNCVSTDTYSGVTYTMRNSPLKTEEFINTKSRITVVKRRILRGRKDEWNQSVSSPQSSVLHSSVILLSGAKVTCWDIAHSEKIKIFFQPKLYKDLIINQLLLATNSRTWSSCAPKFQLIKYWEILLIMDQLKTPKLWTLEPHPCRKITNTFWTYVSFWTWSSIKEMRGEMTTVVLPVMRAGNW